jgi:hypothetical protein
MHTNQRYFRLKNDGSVEATDIAHAGHDRIAQTDITTRKGVRLAWVSTVFLGINHRFSAYDDGDTRPILFETMVFCVKTTDEIGNGLEWLTRQYCTLQEACDGHKQVVREAEELIIAAGVDIVKESER